MRAIALVLVLLGCAHAPPAAYRFDASSGGWELAAHAERPGVRLRRYAHPVHEERLEVFEITRPAPAANASSFTSLADNARALPALGEATAPPRALGDDDVAGARGYWVAQHGRVDSALLGAAAYVVPGARRHFVVRLATRDDDVEQARAWLRDMLLRDFRFPR